VLRATVGGLLLAAVAVSGRGEDAPSHVVDAARLQIELRKLSVVGNVLYIGAHPDDENTGALAYLSLGRGVRTAYLSLTRGEGGQNLLGAEQGDLLGVIRTHELLSARDLDGAEQFFTHAKDFGYSKSADESIRIWGRETTLADIVWVIRSFRPDVVITRFPRNGGGHGHHVASGILAEEAFAAAGDPVRFPEQLQYVSVWQPRRLVWNRYGGGTEAGDVGFDVGAYEPLLGQSFRELGALGRTQHKSQGMGARADRGSQLQQFQHIAGERAAKDLFDGIDLSFGRLPGGDFVGRALAEAYRLYRPADPALSLPKLVEAYRLLSALPSDVWVAHKRLAVADAIKHCAGLALDALADKPGVHPGGDLRITLYAILRSRYPMTLTSVAVDLAGAQQKTTSVNATLAFNQTAAQTIDMQVPADARYSQPYWLSADGNGPSALSPQPGLRGRAEAPADLQARFRVIVDGVEIIFVAPVVFREVDPIQGARYRHCEILPAVSLRLEDPVVVLTANGRKRMTVSVTARADNVAGTLHLRLPAGWRAEPAEIALALPRSGETKMLAFDVHVEGQAEGGAYRAEAEVGGRHIASGVVALDYPHLLPRSVLVPAEGTLLHLKMALQPLRVGYVMGAGDAVPQALRQLGHVVSLLSDDDLLSGDLARFDAIVTGIRAYNVRTVLPAARPRLMEYVQHGGTLVQQYNTLEDLATRDLGPYPFRLSRERVTEEAAPIALAAPEHALLVRPNRVSAKDFEGWVQERGLYFPDQWDPRYETPLATNDPGETALRGGLLYARYGSGAYIYTSYAWFRQLPAGVPGAYRLLANLVAAGGAHAGQSR
jgi:LmbE family N-acetylglucosaminyl deacetylase